MFRRTKTAETDIKRAIQKVLDNRKDNITRLKHLKIILESDPKEAKTLFEDNSSLVFYIFYDVFINVESDLKQRVNRAHKEELDTVLFVFEKVFLLVPELIHRRWQFNCISRLIRKLTHPENSIKIRREGVRLFLIWYQILRENASEECHKLFSQLIPRLNPHSTVPSSSNPSSSGTAGSSRVSTAPASRQSHSRQGSGTLAAVTSHDAVTAVESSPILPPQGHAEEVCEDKTLDFLHIVLQRMVSEVVNIEWPEEDKLTRRRQALHFLLEQFKRFYLPVLFPPTPSQKSPYDDNALYPGGPQHISILNRLSTERDGIVGNDIPAKKLVLYQEEIIRWLSEFVYVGNKSSQSSSGVGLTTGQLSEQDPDVSASVMDVSIASGGASDVSGFPSASSIGDATNPASTDASASGSLQSPVHGSGGGNAQAAIHREPEFPVGAALTSEQVELMREVLYATRENVLLIHELFGRTLNQFATMQHKAVLCVVTVYREWIRHAVKGPRPAFMMEPLTNTEPSLPRDLVKGCGEDDVFRRNDSTEQSVETEDDTVRDSDTTDGSSMHTPSETSPVHRAEASHDLLQSPTPESSPAHSNAVESWLASESVAAGLQRCLQVIFTSSAHVFVLPTSPSQQYGVELPSDKNVEFLKNHESICKMVLMFYRHATIHLTLSSDTWAKLLMVLLRIVWQVMSSTSPDDKESLGSLLAAPLFQTLIVTFVKANLYIRVERELWDNFMSVLSSLTHWPQLIVEWSKLMSTLMRVVAKHVYGLDLRDLPLDRHSKSRARRFHMQNRGQHLSGLGSSGANSSNKSRSERNQTIKSQRSLHRIQALDHQNMQLADSFSCVKLEDDSGVRVEAGGGASVGHGLRHGAATLPSPSPSSTSARASSRSSIDQSGGGGGIGEEVQPLLYSSSSSIGGNHISAAGGGVGVEHDRLSQNSSASDRQPGGLYGVGGGSGGGVGDDTSSYASATEDATSYGAESNSGIPVPESAGNSGGTEGPRGAGQFDYQQLSTSTNTTHGDSSSGCNVSLGFSDTELMSSSLMQAGNRHPVSDFSVSEGSESSADSDLSSDEEDSATVHVARNEQLLSRRILPRHIRQRRKPKNGKGGTLTRDDITGEPLSEEDKNKEEEEDRDAEDEEEDDEDEDTANGRAGSKDQFNERAGRPLAVALDQRSVNNNMTLDDTSTGGLTPLEHKPVISCSAERINSEDPDLLSVMAGGRTLGWTPENCVVLWRRVLCCLGDINAINDPHILRTVYNHLNEMMNNLFVLRRNLGVSVDNVTTPAPPALIPPLFFMVPWFFNTLRLPAAFKQAKLLAMRLLCKVTVMRHDLELPAEHIAQFHRQLHYTLAVEAEQDLVNEVLLNCGPKFFSLSMPGSCLLLLNFIEAAGSLCAINDCEAPRVEAVSILGSLLSFPTHYRLQGKSAVSVLRQASGDSDKNGNASAMQVTTVPWMEVKDLLVDKLLRWCTRESSGAAKAVALSSLGIFVYEELASYPGRSWKLHPNVKDAMNTLYLALKFSEKQVACDMLTLLVEHVELLLHELPDLPLKIVEQCSQALQMLMSERKDTSKSEKRLIVSLIFCLVEWCMHLPVSLLLDSTDSHSKGLIFLVFRVLHCVARGGSHVTPWKSTFPHSVSGGSELDWESLEERLRAENGSRSSPTLTNKNAVRSPKLSSRDGLDMVRLAARTALSHLLNHLGQFPVTNAACLDSFVQEWQEVDLLGLDAPLSDLTPGLFDAPNLQFFTVNDSALLSLLTVPRPEKEADEGLVDGATLVRAIMRDVGGKYCWDARILYGSCAQMPSPTGVDIQKPATPGEQSEETQGDVKDEEERQKIAEAGSLLHGDHLREMLASLEKSSPELGLQPPSKPAPSLDEASAALEEVAKQQLHAEEMWEDQTLLRLDSDSKVQRFSIYDDGQNAGYFSPFYACRHVLSQLGFFAWERRPHIDLLKKKDNLLLELKNLDMRACRETHKIAVIYVGPGQEDKQSVLSNSAGSRGFEDFVAGLGWEVVLDRHSGFRGGLDSAGRTGLTTPYYATSTLEMIFHVATRMPSDSEEDRHRKLKHLGNDEIWLIWSEHERDFRRGLIPTEFGDVMIIVYPLPDRAGLFRVSIDRKPEIPFFGPLFDGVVVSDRVLPGLVRATAINASRANRALKQGYLTFYEERARCLDDIIQRYKKSTTFESFARHCFAPILSEEFVVPNSPTDHVDGNARCSGNATRTGGEPSSNAPGASDKKEGKSKADFSRGSNSRLSWPVGIKFRVRFSGPSNASGTSEEPEMPNSAPPIPPLEMDEDELQMSSFPIGQMTSSSHAANSPSSNASSVTSASRS